ncbi:MAG: DUF4838 domain-containing protein [Lentisphaerae bacterium]|nr:DUF4838 domain-containing protein [Lentisphaerota bacterium]
MSTLPGFSQHGRPACTTLLLLGAAVLLTTAPMAQSASPTPVQLARDGQALIPVVLSEQASPQVRELAVTLTNLLTRMSGATFAVTNGPGPGGLLLGVASNFPALAAGHVFAPADPLQREAYLLRSRADGLHLIGATDEAVSHAVWDLLHRLGYRQFFPGPTWEVVPAATNLALAVDAFEQPDFLTRRIWYGHGLWKYNVQPYQDWCARNRTAHGFKLATSHMYQAVIRKHRSVFAEHPEYLALVDGKRQGGKFCISNAGLRALVLDDVRGQLRQNPDIDCISMEPSDGVGWCECEACDTMGSISDRALTLANEAARMVAREFPGTHIGLLAYSQHSPPPTLRVESNVIVKVQTAFIRGGYTFDDLVRGWQTRGASIGVGDYYSVFAWDHSRPASGKGSDLAYIQESIPRFHRHGARFFMCESSDLWGAIGLGHYVAARLLWDTREAENLAAITDDFFARAFGPAREPMERYYRRIYRFEAGDRRPLIRGDLVARLYRDLAEARTLAAGSPAVMARLDDLLLFTRYEDLFLQQADARGDAKSEALTALLRHVWRMRETMMIHAKPALSRLAPKPKDGTRADLTPYQDPTPFTEQELQAILADGLARYEPIEPGFEPVAFTEELVPATPLNLPEVPDGTYNQGAPMGRQSFYTWRDETDPPEFRLRVSGGHIIHYRNIASPVQLSLFADANPILDEPVAFDNRVPPDGTEHAITLRSTFTGLHRLQVVAPSNRAKVDRIEPQGPMTLPASLDEYNQLTGLWTLYFYVPRGTTVVGGYSAGGTRGLLIDGSGNTQCDFSKLPATGYFRVEIPAGEDGKLWKFEGCNGRRALLTVPPYLARNAAALLLPREVVERDRQTVER